MIYIKIYIIGPVGSGKSTLANKLAKYYNITHYELDNIIWERSGEIDVKRDIQETKLLFKFILNEDNYIIEDVGRDIFKDGIKNSDIIIYFNLNRWTLYKQILFRYFKQKCNIIKTRYKVNLKMLILMFKWANNDINKQNSTINQLKDNCSKLIVINKNTNNTVNLIIERINNYEKI